LVKLSVDAKRPTFAGALKFYRQSAISQLSPFCTHTNMVTLDKINVVRYWPMVFQPATSVR